MKIVKNFLDKEYFEKLKNQIVDNDAIPFYFQATVAHKDDAKDEKQFYFTHVCYNDHVPNSNLFELFKPLVKQINCKSLIRIRLIVIQEQMSYWFIILILIMIINIKD